MTLRERIIKIFSPKGGVWFLSPGLVGREEQEVIQDLEWYADRFVHAMSGIEDLSRAYSKAEGDVFNGVLLQIDQDCDDSEGVRRKIIHRITDQRLFFPDSRKDMLRLLNSMSLALFHLKGFKTLAVPRKPLDDDEQYVLTEVAITEIKLAGTLSDAVRYVNEDPMTALEKIEHEYSYQEEVFHWVEELRRIRERNPPSEEDIRWILFLQQVIQITQDILGALNHVQEIAIQYL
ncbi:MAG: hypothetical protein LUO93_02925 [Methanomicrobiales archaeon]|nr:hypothetical protein [Methanomicrobiales archaeon]